MIKPSESKMFKFVGLQCDAKGCDYKDTEISGDEYENMIEAPCPKCGASLLTQEDFNSIQNMLAMEEQINELGIVAAPGEPIIKASLKMDGSGSVGFENVEITKQKDPEKTYI